MFRNYLTIAFRNLRKHKIFSLINMAGLAIGISAALVIYLIVQYEFNFDAFHKDKDRIHRVVSEIKFPDLTINNSGVPAPTGPTIAREIPGLELVAPYIIANETKVAVPFAGSAGTHAHDQTELHNPHAEDAAAGQGWSTAESGFDGAQQLASHMLQVYLLFPFNLP